MTFRLFVQDHRIITYDVPGIMPGNLTCGTLYGVLQQQYMFKHNHQYNKKYHYCKPGVACRYRTSYLPARHGGCELDMNQLVSYSYI